MTSDSFRKFNVTPAAFDYFAWASQSARILFRAFQLLIHEIRSPVRIPVGRTLQGWRLGFGKLANLVYAIDRNDHRLYITQFQQVLFCPRINGHYDHLLNNKLLFPRLMNSLDLESPKLIGFTRKGALRTNHGVHVQKLPDWLFETLEKWHQVVLKPIKGHKGQGLAFIELSEGVLLVNGFPSSVSDLVSMIEYAPDSVITEFISQADYALALYPRTANTIRVLTIWDYGSNQPFVAAAAQRIGTERSFPIDNWRAGLGGLSSEVNLETGSLSKAATVSSDWELIWYDEHPETHSRIEGLVVPGWTEICQRLTEAARKLAWTPQIAWDVLVTQSGFTVIEINGGPGLLVHQVHQPLLKDSRTRNFYRVHKVIH